MVIERSKPLISCVVPAGLLALALGLLLVSPGEWMSRLHPASGRAVLILLRYAPVVVWTAGVALALHFNSSRLAQMGLFMLLVYLYVMLPYLEPVGGWEGALGSVYYNSQLLFSLLIPLNFMLIHCSRKTPPQSMVGLAKLVLIPLELVGVVGVFVLAPDLVFGLFDRVPQVRILDGRLNLPLLPLALCGLAAVVFCALRWEPSYSRNSGWLIGAMVGGVLSFEAGVRWFESGRAPMHHALMFSVAGFLFVFKAVDLAWGKAYLDSLTGVPDRKALEEYLSGLRGEYSLAMIDIDDFKKFNDRYGHEDGDRVLATVARILEKHTEGTVFRFGGEEFLIVDTNRDFEVVREELESIRKAVADERVTVTRKSPWATKKLDRRVTVSIGLAKRDDSANSPQEVLNAADRALYQAKDDGRNQVSTT